MKEIQKAMALAMVLALAIVVVFGAVGTSDVDGVDYDVPSGAKEVSTEDGLIQAIKDVPNNGCIVLVNTIGLTKTLVIDNQRSFTIMSKNSEIQLTFNAQNVENLSHSSDTYSDGTANTGNAYKLIEISKSGTAVTFQNIIVSSTGTVESDFKAPILLFVTNGASVTLDTGAELTGGGTGVWLYDNSGTTTTSLTFAGIHLHGPRPEGWEYTVSRPISR